MRSYSPLEVSRYECKLLDTIGRHPGISKSELKQAHNSLETDERELLIEGLLVRGLIREETVKTGRKPKTTYYVIDSPDSLKAQILGIGAKQPADRKFIHGYLEALKETRRILKAMKTTFAAEREVCRMFESVAIMAMQRDDAELCELIEVEAENMGVAVPKKWDAE